MRAIRLKATPEDQGLRLDRFIAARAQGMSRMAARRAIETGGVYINRKRTKFVSRPVQTGDCIEIYLSSEADREPAALKIAYEDEMVLIADKPSGVPVQATRETDRGNLYEAVKDHLTAKEGRRPYLGLLHRIDREASGLVLFTKRRAANQSLAQQIRTHTMQRKYVAWVRGIPRITQATIREPIRGEAAVTHYRVAETRGPWARLEVELETGRTHQIRIHLAKAGHPIVGDKRYGGPPARRIALHARELTFQHPATEKATTVRSELPRDFPTPPSPAAPHPRSTRPPTPA